MVGTGLAARLRETMGRRGISGQRLEKEAGISRGYVSHLLAGRRGGNISAEQLGAIARVLGVSAEWLREGETSQGGEAPREPPTSSDPCPARTRAAELALEDRLPPMAIARVMAPPPDPERTVLSWAREMIRAAEESAREPSK
ncbi:MAG: XRE family transcriptional regulator [Acidimicrobiia bacterium]|nr:MAG: XRE family transcriptional regulator [Acidimicrobiia bacterium]